VIWSVFITDLIEENVYLPSGSFACLARYYVLHLVYLGKSDGDSRISVSACAGGTKTHPGWRSYYDESLISRPHR